MKVYSTTLNYPNDTKACATTTLLQNSQQPRHNKNGLSDSQEIIDLTSNPLAIGMDLNNANNSCNINAKTRTYELTNINSNMMTIYDGCVNGTQPMHEMVATTSGNYYVKEHHNDNCRVVNGLDILHGISKGMVEDKFGSYFVWVAFLPKKRFIKTFFFCCFCCCK